MNRTCQLTDRTNHSGEVSLVISMDGEHHMSLCEHHMWCYTERFITLSDILNQTNR